MGTRIVNVDPRQVELEIADTGDWVPFGGEVVIGDKDLAERLLAQEGVWEAVDQKGPAKRKTGRRKATHTAIEHPADGTLSPPISNEPPDAAAATETQENAS